MIDHLDNLLRQLFVSEIDEITSETQVRFQPPDEDWRTFVANLTVGGQPVLALNVYLFDVRENRKLRSNERVRTVDRAIVNETPSPRRVDCHYLITAWSPATNAPQVEPTFDEHRLLYDVTVALTRKESFIPREIFVPGELPNDFPEPIADVELPTVLLPIEGFPKYAEFWGTMGSKQPWRPAVWLVVTLPVIYEPQFAGPMVTSRIPKLGPTDSPEITETLVQIGGHVINTTVSPTEVLGGAWVSLLTPTDDPLQIIQTDAAGRFTFSRLPTNGPTKGKFRLRYQATGLGEKFRDIDVPSPTGEYDLLF